MNVMEPLVSVIVPVYNVENYIEKSIRCIMDQSYKNIEILLIDDGSTDSSPEICDKLASLDSRITVIHKSNGGVSSARNTGITRSNGHWLMFVDSDDLIEPDAIEKLITLNEDREFDFILGSYSWEFRDKSINASLIDNQIRIFDFEQDKSMILSACMLRPSEVPDLFDVEFHALPKIAVPFAKMYKASIIRENELFFNESIALGEDLLFNLRYLSFANSMSYFNTNIYHYVIRKGSAVNSNLDRKSEMICKFVNELHSIVNSLDYDLNVTFDLSAMILIEEFIQNCGMVVSKNGGYKDALNRIDLLINKPLLNMIRCRCDIVSGLGKREKLMLGLIKKGKSATALKICIMYYKLLPSKNRY